MTTDRLRFAFRPIDEAAARTVLQWRYPPPFNVYNTDPADLEAALAGMLDPANGYHTAVDERGQIVAFACFGEDAQVPGGDYSAAALDVGWGLRPTLIGQGHGRDLVTAILALGRDRFNPLVFRITIASFNEASRRVAEKAGFRQVQTFRYRTHWGPARDTWIVLTRPAE